MRASEDENGVALAQLVHLQSLELLSGSTLDLAPLSPLTALRASS